MGHRLVSARGRGTRTGVRPRDSAPSVAVADSLGISYDHSGNVTFQQNLRVRAWTTYISGDTLLQFETEGHDRAHSGSGTTTTAQNACALRSARCTRSRTSIRRFSRSTGTMRLGAGCSCERAWTRLAQCPSTEVTRRRFVASSSCSIPHGTATSFLFEQRTRGGWQRGDASHGDDRRWRVVGKGSLHALGADRRAVTCVEGRRGSNPRIVHRNWRGNALVHICAHVDSIDSSTVWPAALTDVWLAPDANQTLPEPNRWLGSLTTDQK
jgi:hypothetical protein